MKRQQAFYFQLILLFKTFHQWITASSSNFIIEQIRSVNRLVYSIMWKLNNSEVGWLNIIYIYKAVSNKIGIASLGS